MFKLRPMSVLSVLNPIFPSATMEQEPLYHCHDCHHRKRRDQFALRKRTDKYGAKGEPTSRCSSCTEQEQGRRENRKRKRDEEGPDASRDPGEPNRTISLEQFTTQLHENALTGTISYSANISTQELSGEADDLCTVIVGRVWEATGFRFTCGRFIPLDLGTMANPPILQSDTKRDTSRRTGPSCKYTNAVKRQPAPTLARRWSLNRASSTETPAEWLVSHAMDYSI